MNSSLEIRKSMIRKFSAGFIIFILLLVFFSKTIEDFLLPVVETVPPQSGYLQMDIEEMGELKVATTEKIFAEGNWKIKMVKVKEGDRIKSGDLIAVINPEEAVKNIKIAELQCQQLERDVKNGEKEVEATRSLVEAGSETQNHLDAIIDSLQRKRTDLEIKKLDLESMQRNLPAKGEIRAAEGGVIQSLSIQDGSICNAGEEIFQISKEKGDFFVEWKLEDKKSKLLKAGGNITVVADVPEELKLDGVITNKEYMTKENIYRYKARIDGKGKSSGLQDGQQVKVQYKWTSKNYPMLVPNSCVIRDGYGYCVYVLQERDGTLGKQKYVEKISVKILEQDDFTTAVEGALNIDSKIVSISSKLLEDGMQVKVDYDA